MFRLWYCSLPAYTPPTTTNTTCLSSNLCFFTILTPTLTHSLLLYSCRLSLTTYLYPPPPSLLHTPFLFTGQQVLSGYVYSHHHHHHTLSLSLPVFLLVSLSLSLAAGRRREKAITAAHEGGWKKKRKKKHTRKTAQTPSGLSTPIPPPPQTHTPKPHLNLWRFLTRQTEGKTVAVGRHRVAEVGARFFSPTWWSQPQRAGVCAPRGSLYKSCLVACMRSVHLNPLTTI